jgi:hypothetical protein
MPGRGEGKGLRNHSEPVELLSREFALALADNQFWETMDQAHAKAQSEAVWQNLSIGVATAVSVSVSTGYVIWVLRGSYLAASLLSAAPAWAHIDPLPVLEAVSSRSKVNGMDQESLVDIVSQISGEDGTAA